MNNAAYAMKMPTSYVEMTSTDLEYDGGWSWKKFWTGMAVASLVVAAVFAPMAAVGYYASLSTLFTVGTIGTSVAATGLFAGVCGECYYENPNHSS